MEYCFGKVYYVSSAYDGLVYVYNMTEDRALTLVQTIGTVVEQTKRGGCCYGAWGGCVRGVFCFWMFSSSAEYPWCVLRPGVGFVTIVF